MVASKDQTDVYDVVVIGGGWSGVLSCKYALENGLSVVVLEKRSDLGGVWNYTDDLAETTVLKTTVTSSSSALTEMSDFPMPEEIGEFPHHKDVLAYLKAYCEKFDLVKHFRFGCGVERTEKSEGGIWGTFIANGDVIKSKNLITSIGLHQQPNVDLKTTTLKDFKGEVHHCGNFKDFDPKHTNKRVMVIGGGEMASDFIDLWRLHVGKLIWCIPRGQQFIRKFCRLNPLDERRAVDKEGTRLQNLFTSPSNGSPGKRTFARWLTNGSLTAYGGHGIPEFKTNAGYMQSFVNKQSHVLRFVEDGSVTPKGKISSVDGKTIFFSDSSRETVDIIILCTGFKHEFDILPPSMKNLTIRDCYKMCLCNDDPSLAFVGFVRPVVGSIPLISEVQARFATRVFSGKIQLAEKSARDIVIVKDNAYWDDFFKATSRRVEGLVEVIGYLDGLSKVAGIYPDYWKLLLRNPRGFFIAITTAYSAPQFRLNEPEHEAQALKTLYSNKNNVLSHLYIFLWIFARLILLDWICETAMELKYFLQKNKLAQKWKNYQLVKMADSVWRVPKMILFDDTSKTS